MPTCSIKQCRARTATNPGLTLHRLPSNKTMKKKWLEIIGAENMKTKVKMWYVCSLHFDESSINRTLQVSRLKEGAMPSPALLPKPTSSSKISNSKTRVSQKPSCENENEARSPSPMESDMSEDSSSEETLTEEAINPSGWGKSCTTFAEAWSPIRDSPAPMAINRVTNMKSPNSAAINPATKMDSSSLSIDGPPTNKSKSQQFLQTITIHRQNNKIKTLTKKCRIYQLKVKSLYEKIRRRDGRIAQLSYVIERLKENICFNNEGAIILDETEDPEDLAEANTQIRNLKDCTPSSTVSTTNKINVPRSTTGRRPLSSRTITPEPLPSASRQTKHLRRLVTTSHPPPSTNKQTRPLASRVTTSNPLISASRQTRALLSCATTPDPKPSVSTRTRSLNSAPTQDAPLSATIQTKPTSSCDTISEPVLSATSQTKLPISVLALNTSKSHNGTNVSKETNSKDLMFVISPLTINTKKKAKSKQLKYKLPSGLRRRTLRLRENKDRIKDTTSQDLKVEVPPSPSPNRKMLEIQERTDAIESNTSKDLQHKAPRPPNSKTIKLYDSSELIKDNTIKDLKLDISPQSNRKIINIRDSADHTKDKTSEKLKLKSPPSPPPNRKLINIHDITDLMKDTTEDLIDTVPPLSNKNKLKANQSMDVFTETSIETTPLVNEKALTPQECTDLEEITLKDITNSSVTDKNAFIYIIEVD